MRFTPILIIYCILMFGLAVAIRKLNFCQQEVIKLKDRVHILEDK